jgi:dynein heavy chain 2
VLLQTALKEGAAQLSFMGKQVEVNPAAGLFVTLNPAGKGYGGRSKLPDNLKQMFRCASSALLQSSLSKLLRCSELHCDEWRGSHQLGR